MTMKRQWRLLHETRVGSAREVVEVLLRNRKAESSFLNGTLKDLEVHLSIRGMDEGAELMAKHLADDSRIVLVGDYDCDGITSAAQMSLFLREIGHRNFDVIIPNRSEGYGIPERAIHDNPGAGLLVAMDCGTLDECPISLARSKGVDCIVIDHHEAPGKSIAPATALINPKHPECPSKFKEFCASGLTLLFLARLRRALSGRFDTPALGGKYLALAGLGTVADLMPLTNANRILTRSALNSINQRTYPPIRRIAETAGLSGRTLTAGHLGFYLGPRINAAGRMAEGQIAFDLLTSEDPGEIDRLAQELNRLNTQRQSEENAILNSVRHRLAEGKVTRRTLALGDPQWRAGVVGIVASRIQQELHYGPVIVFSVNEAEGTAQGSARSVSGFDIHSALTQCDDLLLKWGGHKMAAGMTVKIDRIRDLADRLEEIARAHPPEIFVPIGKVDMELDLDLLSGRLCEDLKQLEPHGLGNPLPTFAARRVRVGVKNVFGKEQKHLKMTVGARREGVYWRGALHRRIHGWNDGDFLDVVFNVEWDEFSGKPLLNIKDAGNLF